MERHDDPSGLMAAERDACAIICYINTSGRPTHGNVQRTIEALVKMGHRAGEINGEGDGCGILTDIPRLLWEEVLAGAGLAQDIEVLVHDEVKAVDPCGGCPALGIGGVVLGLDDFLFQCKPDL